MAASTFVQEFDQAVQWLAEAWDTTSEGWNDQVRSAFEGDYWAPMTRAAAVFGEQLSELATVLDRALAEAP
jgi:hypothetical protein